MGKSDKNLFISPNSVGNILRLLLLASQGIVHTLCVLNLKLFFIYYLLLPFPLQLQETA